MAWSVTFTAKVAKKCRTLPEGVRKSLVLLAAQIEERGPVRGDWPNYSKLGPRRHHCHIRKGRPTYQAVEKWRSAASAEKARPLMYAQYTARPGFFRFLASHHF